MKLSRIALFAAAAGFLPSQAFAAPLGFRFTIEPVVGYERVEKIFPDRHFVSRFFYGVLVTGGIPLASLEAEYTRGRDDERFPDLGITQVDDLDRLKLGVRSRFDLTNFLWLVGRGGVQATKLKTTRTEGGVTTATSFPITYDPYAGAALQVRLASTVRGEVGVTAVFKDFPRMEHNDYQVHAGFSIQLGSSPR